MSRGQRAVRSSAIPTRVDGPPDWYRDAIIYELHVRAFADSNGDGIGDFNGLAHRLDYLADLGVTAIWLLPFYPSPLRDDGYDIGDYRTVHPDYGDLRQFRRFLDAAHARNIRVITELVVNHTSDQHPWFQTSRKAPPGSTERDFYVWSDTTDRYSDARVIFQDFEQSNWTWDPVAESYFWHRFYSHQPDLNYDNPDVEAAIFDVLDYWLEMGVDGLRLDAVPYLYEREGTNCENLDETHQVLKRLRKHLDAQYPDRMLLAEANQWPEDAAAYFGDGDECHMNFHFPVMPRLFMALRLEHRTPIVDIMEQTPEPPPGGQWATFLRNHDELTLEMVTDEERDLMLRAYATDLEMRINLGIRRRLAPLLGNDRRKIELLNAVLLFSLPGTPVIYYGDEIGMGDNVYLGDRNGVRTPMQWTADRNAGFSTANPHRLYLPLITEQGYHYESINVETQAANPASLLSWMRQLISLRKRHRVLGRGSIEFLEPENAHVLAFIRHPTPDMDASEKPMLCVANLSRLAQQVELDLRDFPSTVPVEVFGQNRFSPVTDRPYSLTLTPYGFMWFAMDSGQANVDPTGGIAAPPRLAGSWPDVLRRRAALARSIGRWMPSRRWFAGKDATVRDVTIDDIIQLSDDVALVIVRTSFTEGDDQQYAVPLLHVSDERGFEADQQKPGALLTLIDDGALVDAMAVPEGAGVVAIAALRRRTRRGRNSIAVGHPRRPGLTKLTADQRDVHVLGVEQSNSSVILGGRVIAKLIRQLSPGENPDVTLPLHLRAAGFDRVPGVAGTLDVAIGGDLGSNVVVVHDAIGNEADLWQWSQDLLTREVERLVTEPESTGDEAVLEAVTNLLGKRTAQMHLNLAGGAPAFEPERFSLLFQRSIQQSLRQSLRETQRAVRRNRTRLPADAQPMAVDLLEHGDRLLAAFDTLRTRKLDAARIRVHGDLHLGQALWTGRDVVFIDFEGEPGRSIGERSIKRSPLSDVAGLLRSFDYAGRVALATSAERGRTRVTDEEFLERWRGTATTTMQDRFWSTYRTTLREGTTAAGSGARLIPADDADARLLLDAHIVLKALYEVRYELANRPGWVSWPLAAVVQLLARP